MRIVRRKCEVLGKAISLLFRNRAIYKMHVEHFISKVCLGSLGAPCISSDLTHHVFPICDKLKERPEGHLILTNRAIETMHCLSGLLEALIFEGKHILN